MKHILFLSDFIEGQPIVASVRYEGLLKYLKDKYKITVVNDYKYGNFKSKFAFKNFKFITSKQEVNEQLGSNKVRSKKLDKVLRSKYILKFIRTILHGNLLFDLKNKVLYKNLERYILEENVDVIFLTVPYIYNLYILKKIKRRFPSIPVIVEVRDILAHNIGKGYPIFTYKKAESVIYKYSNHVIALSEGIYNYYSKQLNKSQGISIIKNGFEESDFLDCKYTAINNSKDFLRFAHIGSIYEGRNLHDFLEALTQLQKHTKYKVVLDIVGILDKQAQEELNYFLSKSNQIIKINLIGTVSHKDAINYLKTSDIAVILTHVKGSEYAIPGKTFEYIGACKPILAVSEDPGLVELVHNKFGVCAKHNANDIFNGIMNILRNNYNFEDRRKYSRQRQAEKTSQIIDNIGIAVIQND